MVFWVIFRLLNIMFQGELINIFLGQNLKLEFSSGNRVVIRKYLCFRKLLSVSRLSVKIFWNKLKMEQNPIEKRNLRGARVNLHLTLKILVKVFNSNHKICNI